MPPSPRTALAVSLAALLVGDASCAARPLTREQVAAAPSEALVEVLPSAARLSVDGVVVGQGTHTVLVRDPARPYRFRATAPGFEPVERVEDGAKLAGARISLVLAPTGSVAPRPPDLDDGESLALAAETLADRGDRASALEYADRAAHAAPDAPAVRRVLQRLQGAATIEVHGQMGGSLR